MALSTDSAEPARERQCVNRACDRFTWRARVERTLALVSLAAVLVIGVSSTSEPRRSAVVVVAREQVDAGRVTNVPAFAPTSFSFAPVSSSQPVEIPDMNLTPLEALKRAGSGTEKFCPICKKGHPGAFVHGPERN